jgi:DNA-binding ferritin-like protein (Dps family)
MSKLDDLLNKIDPRKTIDRCDSLRDKALNSYEYSNNALRDFNQFTKAMGDFYWHVESTMMGVGKNIVMDDEMRQGFAFQALNEIYGMHGMAAAFSMAQSGVEDGLYGVLKKMGQAIAKKHLENQIGVEVAQFINELMDDFELYDQCVAEYARKYARILPPEYLENDAVDLKINFRQVLENHPYLIRRMSSIGNNYSGGCSQ